MRTWIKITYSFTHQRTHSLDKKRRNPLPVTTNQQRSTNNYLAVRWWPIGGRWPTAAAGSDYSLAWCSQVAVSGSRPAVGGRLVGGLVAVHHQLEVDWATPLVAIVLDVLRPRFALDVDQDTRCGKEKVLLEICSLNFYSKPILHINLSCCSILDCAVL